MIIHYTDPGMIPMVVIKEVEVKKNKRDKITSLLMDTENNVSKIGSIAQHIIDTANKNQKERSK